MRIAFAGGGTGGHVYPALAVAREILNRRPETEVLFIGGARGIERKIVGGAGFPVETITACGMPRKTSPAIFSFAWKLGMSILRSRSILKRFHPQVVMATGGYVSGPPVIAAHLLGIPAVIQEQNSFPGITNRKLSRYADMVFLGFEDARKYFSGPAEVICTGNPVRGEIGAGNRMRVAETWGLDPARKTLLVFGGSQGAQAVNRAVSGDLDHIASNEIQILWQTGDREFETWKKHDGSFGGRVKVVPYIDVMADAYALADLVVARAGAMSIAEITACGLPAIFIPLPTAAENHQEHNARSLADAGAAVMIREADLAPSRLGKEVAAIMESETRRGGMAEASRNLGRTDAAARIAERIIERYGTE